MRRLGVMLVAALTCVGCGSHSEGDGEPASDEASPAESTTTTGGGTSASGSESSSSSSSSGGNTAPEIDCGITELHGKALRRFPYLQSIDDTSARVAWTTTNGGEGVVRFAPTAEGPWTEVTAASTLFEVSYTYDTEDYFAFDATLTGLSPNSAYCYEVLEDGEVLGRGLSFQTAWSGSGRSVRVLAFGDSGNFSPEQKGLRDQMLTRKFDIFLHLGDMAYGSGTFSEFEERVFKIYRHLLHKIPTYPAPGNHEYKTDEAQPYLDVYYLWEMALREQDQERYYSFDYGEVHFVSLDSNPEILLPAALDTENEQTDDMLDWLEADLAASDKPWKIAFFHHPPYTSSERAPNLLVRNGLLPILEEGAVDLVLCGHDHHYERTQAIREGKPTLHEQGGIYYFVVGSGGAGLRAATGDWWTETVDDQNHAFLDLTIDGCVATGQAVGIEGQIVDEFEISGC